MRVRLCQLHAQTDTHTGVSAVAPCVCVSYFRTMVPSARIQQERPATKACSYRSLARTQVHNTLSERRAHAHAPYSVQEWEREFIWCLRSVWWCRRRLTSLQVHYRLSSGADNRFVGTFVCRQLILGKKRPLEMWIARSLPDQRARFFCLSDFYCGVRADLFSRIIWMRSPGNAIIFRRRLCRWEKKLPGAFIGHFRSQVKLCYKINCTFRVTPNQVLTFLIC